MSKLLTGEELWKLLRDAALIILLAVLTGAVINGRLLRQIWLGQPSAVVSSDSLPVGELLPMPVSLAEIKSSAAGEILLVDARSKDLYLQGHLPAARNLPWGEIETFLESFRHEVPVDQPLVAYCSGYGCEDSFNLAQRLMAEGYEDVRVFEGGLPEWQDAGLPVEEGQP